MSKMKNIDIAAENLPEIEEEEASQMLDMDNLPPEQNLMTIIEADNTSMSLASHLKKDKKKSMNEPINELDQDRTFYCRSKGVQINIHGVKTETTFLLTTKRFCIFDSKLRLSKYVPIENIKYFIFCRNNPTLFVVRPKNTHQLNAKEHLNNPLIISTRYRASFASFLTRRMAKVLA